MSTLDLSKFRRVSKRVFLFPVDPDLLPQDFKEPYLENKRVCFDARHPRIVYRRPTIQMQTDLADSIADRVIKNERVKESELLKEELEFIKQLVISIEGNFSFYSGLEKQPKDLLEVVSLMTKQDYLDFAKELAESANMSPEDEVSFLGI